MLDRSGKEKKQTLLVINGIEQQLLQQFCMFGQSLTGHCIKKKLAASHRNQTLLHLKFL